MQKCIQYDDKGRSLYSSEEMKCISENKNLDICVSDYAAGAVVVVIHNGKHRFTYTGHASITDRLFHPRGITTDSIGRILTINSSQYTSCNVHILDQEGQFLSFIDNCHLSAPWGICVDTKDNLYVAEHTTGYIVKIRYV